jgi:hypothetical protein
MYASRRRDVGYGFEVPNNNVSRCHSTISGDSGGFLLQIVDQMGERWLVEIMQHVSQFFVARSSRSESGSIRLAQRRYERIAVLLADFAILVSMTAVEARLLCHDGFFGSIEEGAGGWEPVFRGRVNNTIE